MDQTQLLTPAVDFERESAIFSRHLSQAGTSLELPLAARELPSLWEKAFHWLRDLLGGWMPSPGADTLSGIGKILAFLAQNWFFLVCLLIAGVAVYAVYRLYRYPRTRKSAPAARLALRESTLNAVEDELARAVAAGHFARAAKLRWTLFLGRALLAPSVTPREARLAPRELPWIYSLMFAAGTDTAQGYSELEGLLSGEERMARAKGAGA